MEIELDKKCCFDPKSLLVLYIKDENSHKNKKNFETHRFS